MWLPPFGARLPEILAGKLLYHGFLMAGRPGICGY